MNHTMRCVSRAYLLQIAGSLGFVLPLALFAGCATTPEGPAEEQSESSRAEAAEAVPAFPRISYEQEAGPLYEVVRHIGEEYGGSLVLMNGIEGYELGRLRYNQVKLREVALELAERSNCGVQETPHYLFLYPAQGGYGALTETSLVRSLDPKYQDIQEAIMFGHGLQLFEIFRWLSAALDITVVGDNAIAAARCGELTLGAIPFPAGLEAILKSARIPPGFQVQSTEEYIFLSAEPRYRSAPILLNEEELEPRQLEYLETRVTVHLPHPPQQPGQFEWFAGASVLDDVLPSLSDQLGIKVVAERGLRDLPVNPVIFNDVRIRTALDLLIRQWLRPDFGYHMTHDRIVIRRVRPSDQPAPMR